MAVGKMKNVSKNNDEVSNIRTLINNNIIINYNYDDKCDKTHGNTCKSCFYTQ